MDNTDLITPKDDTTAQPEDIQSEQTQPENTAEGSGIPEEVLKIPAMQAIFAGSPPAVSGSLKNLEKTDEGKIISQNAKDLMQAGIGFYRSLSGDTAVMFNQMFIHPEEIKQADKAGKLLQIAPPFDKVNHAVKTAALGQKPAIVGKAPTAMKGPPPVMPPQIAQAPLNPMSAPSVRPPPASSATKLLSARLRNLSPTPPTGGSSPGQGQLLAAIRKPVL